MALVLVVRARRPFCFGDRMNKIEQIKVEKDGLDVGADIPRYAQLGFEAIEEGDLERLKWWGVFFRRHTPGYFMMRIRIPNGITNAVRNSDPHHEVARRVAPEEDPPPLQQQVQLR